MAHARPENKWRALGYREAITCQVQHETNMERAGSKGRDAVVPDRRLPRDQPASTRLYWGHGSHSWGRRQKQLFPFFPSLFIDVFHPSPFPFLSFLFFSVSCFFVHYDRSLLTNDRVCKQKRCKIPRLWSHWKRNRPDRIPLESGQWVWSHCHRLRSERRQQDASSHACSSWLRHKSEGRGSRWRRRVFRLT
jgi:hypothetical protein